MKILVLNGSPRANGNTAAMVEAFKKGAEGKGNEVTVVEVAKKKIAGCLGCEYCHTKGEGACVQKDDMQEVYPLLAEADAVVYASPIYYFTMSGQMQCAISRFYAPMKPAKAKKAAMMLSSGSPGVYDAAIAQFNVMTGFMGMETVGIITANGEENKSEAKLAECEELGAKF
jgi:multimeric flavodoxin WrbA